MAEADVYSLFAGDEASAQEQAMALANALRQRQQQAAQLRGLALGTSLGENPMLAGLNRSATQAADALSGEAGQQQGLLAQAGGQRAGHALQRAMQAQSMRMREQELRESAAARRENRLEGRALREALAGQRSGERLSEHAEKDVDNYAKRTEGTATVLNDLRTLQAAAAKEDVPGVSKGYRFVPDFMEGLLLDKEELDTRQAARGMVGTLLKMRSGTAASDSEVARVMAELGMGPNASEEEFRAGLQRLTQNYRDELAQKASAMRPEAQGRARERGLLMPEDFPAQGGQGGGIGLEAPALSEEDAAAVEWARQHPNDPRAAAILQLHGVK